VVAFSKLHSKFLEATLLKKDHQKTLAKVFCTLFWNWKQNQDAEEVFINFICLI